MVETGPVGILFPKLVCADEIKIVARGNKFGGQVVWTSETRPRAARAPWNRLKLAPLVLRIIREGRDCVAKGVAETSLRGWLR
jgi:hypothetical protein